ncbi:Phenylcoumaran benzylic ether reductase Betv6 [Sesamum angolense]|uniref:Phenylcoumaran benzylic ether reductase Betv6 n=1 Tax=Sesamum angolense TaxID=2727404 RepID=A0AAE2BME1_9LAMI|nr:Phenylcoumaran benzylic ether reductase Betv6 [Sesamum angolense]
MSPSNYFAGYSLTTLMQPGLPSPRDKVTILGDGNAKGVFNDERDIATYTIRAVDDPRTLNKTLYIRLQNTYSFHEIVAIVGDVKYANSAGIIHPSE